MDYRLLIGILGSAILIAGAMNTDQKEKNIFFAIGNACMFLYALIGYLTGEPIFFLIFQIFIAISTLCMLFKVPDRYDLPILAIGGLALVGWSLFLFEDYTTVIFVVGLVILGIGFSMESGTFKREITMMTGSAMIALFSFFMKDWIFFGVNVIFNIVTLFNLRRLAY